MVSCPNLHVYTHDGNIRAYRRPKEFRNTLTYALGGNRGYDFAANAAGHACPACGKFMDFFADFEG